MAISTSLPTPATPDRTKRFSRLLGVRESTQSSPRVHAALTRHPDGGLADSEKVTVCIRFKPPSTAECYHAYEFAQDRSTLSLSESHPTVIKRNGKAGREKEYTYRFSGIYLAPEPTLSLYERQIAPLVAKAMAGFNSTIFAYGQTGSGKTHTMSGTSDDVGIIPLAVSGVFEAIEQNPGRQYLLRVSYLEIYNETLRDILQPIKGVTSDKDKPVLHVIEGNVVVRPLKEEIVRTPEEVLGLLERGQKNRRTGATDWNERSSRSHCVFTMTIESRLGADVRQSRLTLIDLAGSEKAASNLERLAEGKHINRSLLALGTVIELLSDKNRRPSSHIPYRNSKLTHLLENALGGNANIAVICTLSAEVHHSSETLESLKFASRCAQVETQATQGIIAASEKALLQAKEEEIMRLREQIQTLTSARPQEQLTAPIEPAAHGKEHTLHHELEHLEERRNKLVDQLKSLNSEILSSQSGLTPGAVAGIGQAMRRRVSDFIRMHPDKTNLGSDSGTPSRRAVSGKILTIDEEDNDDPVLSNDVIQAFKRQRSADKQTHNLLLGRLAEAEAAVLQAEEMRLEVESLKQCLAEETARSEHLMKQLAGRDRLESRQNDVIRDLEKQLAATRVEVVELRTRKSALAEPASLPSVNTAGLPGSPERDQVRIPQKSSLPDRLALPMQPQCPDCQRYLEQSKTQETIIQGQQSINRALMEKVGDWQKRVVDQDDLIQRLLPKLRIQEKENTFATPALQEDISALTSPDKNANRMPRSESCRTGSPYKTHTSQSPSKPYLYNDRPRPLPMTETQESNFSTRGHRRVTIEHDINRLQSMNRVDKTRSLFASPERP